MATCNMEPQRHLQWREREKPRERERERKRLTLAVFESIAGQIGRYESLVIANELLLLIRGGEIVVMLARLSAQIAVVTC